MNEMYSQRLATRKKKRADEGELNSDQILTTNVSNNILESITSPDGVVSNPYGVNVNGKTKDLMSHSKMFEAFLSTRILNEPGEIGMYLDEYTKKLSVFFDKLVNNNELGSLPVFFQNKNMTAKEAFKLTTFGPLSANSDQIGRMPSKDLGETTDWLAGELTATTGSGNFKRVLTKVKAISSFGTTIWQLLSSGNKDNIESLKILFSASGLENSDQIDDSFVQFRGKTRSSMFDNPVTRARSERMPLLNGSPIDGEYSDAASHGLGFGQVVQSSRSDAETKELQRLLAGSGAKNSQINAIPRQNAPIGDLDRPYMLSDEEYNQLPKEYDDFGLKSKIDEHRFNHGVGINRWQAYGSFGTQANISGYPSAGAQSGGTTDVMLALQMLSGGKIYNSENSRAVEAITLAVGAFMNFGGYHTFTEVYPVGMSVSRNEVMDPAVTAAGFKHSPLYLEMLLSYNKFHDKTDSDSDKNSNAHLKYFKRYRDQTISHRNPTIAEEKEQ